MRGFELSIYSFWKGLLIIVLTLALELIIGYEVLSIYGFTKPRVALWSVVIVVSSTLLSFGFYWRELRKMSKDDYYADEDEDIPSTEITQGEETLG